MQDGASFATRPSLPGADKREPEERRRALARLLNPIETGVRGSIDHAAFTDDPTDLTAGKTDSQEVQRLCTESDAGQGTIDPAIAPVDGLKHGPHVADAHPWDASLKNTSKRVAALWISCFRQAFPASAVKRMVPNAPTAVARSGSTE